jgi:N-[(2S)-2-amino-2-carboxyethyl]-L-glutamate dehydrogenase
MTAGDLLVLGADEVAALLRGRESDVLSAVTRAYETHARGRTVVPHSTFLRLPGGRNRIIALPAQLGSDRELVGMKWIASFPGNLDRGLERASGLVVLNCGVTGRPHAVLEASVVSAQRTAASAALAAQMLHPTLPTVVGLLGCGAINFETLRFLLHVWPDIARVRVCDLDPDRAARFAARCRTTFRGVAVECVDDTHGLVHAVSLLSIATTAVEPHLDALDSRTLRTVLHLSLRDLTPGVILAADNVADDADHVCRAETSLDRAAREVGSRGFISRTLPAILIGAEPRGGDHDRVTIFSPFGLGILDLAVAELVCERAAAQGVGTRLPFAARETA